MSELNNMLQYLSLPKVIEHRHNCSFMLHTPVASLRASFCNVETQLPCHGQFVTIPHCRCIEHLEWQRGRECWEKEVWRLFMIEFTKCTYDPYVSKHTADSSQSWYWKLVVNHCCLSPPSKKGAIFGWMLPLKHPSYMTRKKRRFQSDPTTQIIHSYWVKNSQKWQMPYEGRLLIMLDSP